MSSEEDLKSINEIIAARFKKIEDAIESAETITELFENLIDGIENEFTVPFVWLTLIDHQTIAPVLGEIKMSERLESRLSVVSKELFDKILTGGIKPVLANKDLQPFYRLLPHSRKYFIRSVAVVPFTMDGQIIGTWNNGDADANRYEPDMKTDLIESLSGKLSARLTRLALGKESETKSVGSHDQTGENHD
ncbi:MAG: GAF domain-containing protein [Smithellaceae bacterium]|nr:GAF domain-containing protein [Smithellaceae bacterium]